MDPKKIIWAPKNVEKAHFGLQKMEKIDFLQNLDLPDLAEHGRGFPQCPTSIPNKPFSWRILYIKILLRF